jgi:defect-in-organelle-trafficking protein DotC
MPKPNWLCLLLTVSLVCACTSRRSSTDNLSGLQNLSNTKQRFVLRQVSEIRKQALRDTAISIAAQSGLASRAAEINKILLGQQRQLDSVYNFNALLLEHNVLPPVLVEGRATHNLEGEEEVRISDRSYRIIKQARFVTTTPHWREYLELHYSPPEKPHPTLLPNPNIPGERKVWKEAITEGWKQGLEQADIIFSDNVARLTEDYVGMVRYRSLLNQGMVSEPFVSRTELGVTGTSEELNINDQVLRIVALPALNNKSKHWQSLMSGSKLPMPVTVKPREKVQDITPQESDWKG